MPGSGYKDFAAGDVLTADQVDGYLMKQAVMYFADATARNTAITSPEEGMHAYLADSDTITEYSGAAWRVIPGGVTTAGDLAYFNGTSWVKLGIGTASQVLKVNSGATAPEWAAETTASVGNLLLTVGDLAAVNGSPTLAGLLSSVYWPGWMLDAATQEAIASTLLIPAGWSTVDIDVWWTNAGAGSGDVRFDLRINNYGDTETIATPTASESTVTAPAQNVMKKSTLRTGVTATAGEMASVILFRVAADAADTLANDIAVFAINVRKAS